MGTAVGGGSSAGSSSCGLVPLGGFLQLDLLALPATPKHSRGWAVRPVRTLCPATLCAIHAQHSSPCTIHGAAFSPCSTYACTTHVYTHVPLPAFYVSSMACTPSFANIIPHVWQLAPWQLYTPPQGAQACEHASHARTLLAGDTAHTRHRSIVIPTGTRKRRRCGVAAR